MAPLDRLWPYPQQVTCTGAFPKPAAVAPRGEPLLERWAEDLESIGGVRLDPQGAYPLQLAVGAAGLRPEGYVLTLAPTGASVTGADAAGLAYGVQTLVQALALHRHTGQWPALEIRDWPAYRKRSFMVDLGRSVFPLPMLQRIVRILARLKMNQLHLHLTDDELCGLRFEGLPFGQENPFALTLPDLAGLVRYAAEYHVEIVPEIECWGHAGSVVFHRPQLRGGPGTFAGASFLIGEGTFALVAELVGQVAQTLPSQGTIHFGLDEAKWFAAPELPAGFGPDDMMCRYYDILQAVAARTGKALTMRVWADHGCRAVPAAIQAGVIAEPWQYWNKNRDQIAQDIARFSGPGKMRWMMGGGTSWHHHRGAYHATRFWCRQALSSPNVEGVNLTFWSTNDLTGRFLSLFAGAYYAWNPAAPTEFCALEDYEMYDRLVGPILHEWQTHFAEARPDELVRAAGPLVCLGRYLWGPRHGQPVAPTAAGIDTLAGHDFLRFCVNHEERT